MSIWFHTPGELIGCSASSDCAKNGLKRQKSISSQAESISAWCAVFDWLSIVAAFTVERHVVVSSSAALRKTAARSSHVQFDHSCQAAREAAIACATCFGPAMWYSASTCLWSCGITALAVLPVRTALPPMTMGISICSPAIFARRALSSAFSGEPAA